MKELFKGRINRRNFGLGLLSSIGILFLGFWVLLVLGKNNFDDSIINIIANFLWLAVLIGVLVFNLSVFARRWHDLGQSGWLTLLNLIPYVGLLVLLYLLIAEGNSKPNKYSIITS